MLTQIMLFHIVVIHLWAGLLGFAALLLLSLLAAYFWFRLSLPRWTGQLAVPGLSAPLEIIRDSDGIPHIYAAAKTDAYFGLGYVHAQDRLWQMDFQRRVGRGRVAEVLGKRGVPFDMLAKTIGFARVAEQTWNQLDRPTRDAIEAYSRGVNAFLACCPRSRMAPEFFILRTRPAPWTGPDTILLSLLLSWTLAGNHQSELLRQRLCEAVGEDRCKELMPGYFDIGGPVHPFGMNAASSLIPGFEAAGSIGEGAGSNLWALGPARTSSGGAVLANDPHLPSTNPMTWYLAHLCAPGLEVIGATTPGIPAIMLGRNRMIAWGMTNLNPDVQDFYRERLDESGLFAEFRGAQEALQILEETISVRGSASISLRVRITRHGPLAEGIMGLKNGAAEPLAFRWTGLDPSNTSVTAFLRLNEAHDWESFCAALRLCTSAPVNFGYADARGNFGFHSAGKVPIRSNGDGSAPTIGWTGENEWTGFIPFDELPHSFNPREAYLILINTAPPDPDYPYLLTTDWVEPYRRERIREFITGKERLSVEDHAALQIDTISLFARHALPVLIPLVTPKDSSTSTAIALLQEWDGNAAGNSAAAAIFCAWTLELPRALLGAELSTDLLSSYEGWPSWTCRFMLNAIEGKASVRCDPAEAARISLEKAVSILRSRLGNDLHSWRWDAVHRAVFPHSPLNTQPLLRRLFSYSVPVGGDWSTVNLGGILSAAPFDQRNIAGYRQIVDMSQPGGKFIHAGAQCGHFLARRAHYTRDWAGNKYRQMRFERADVERDAAGALLLKPIADKHLN